MSKFVLVLLIGSAVFVNENAHGAKILCAPTLEVEKLSLKADEQGLLRGVSPTSKLILSDVEISTKPTPAVLPLANFSDRQPRWVRGSLKHGDDRNKLHLHCHYHYSVAVTTVPVDARSCKVKLNYTGLWVSNMGGVDMSTAMSSLRNLLMVLASVLVLVCPCVWSRSQAEVVACPKAVAVEVLQLNHKQADQPYQSIIQPKAPNLEIPLTAVGLAMDQLPKQQSRHRLVGHFSWIFNKDPALRVKRPMPQLG